MLYIPKVFVYMSKEFLTHKMHYFSKFRYNNVQCRWTRTHIIYIFKFQGGLAGLAGQFPSEYMGSLVQGQAIGGIITAIVNILSIASEGSKSSPSNSAFYCFLVAAIFIALDTIALIAMTKTKFYKVCSDCSNKK